MFQRCERFLSMAGAIKKTLIGRPLPYQVAQVA